MQILHELSSMLTSEKYGALYIAILLRPCYIFQHLQLYKINEITLIFADSYRLSEEAKLLEQDLKNLLDPEVSINTIFRNI